MRNAGLLGGYFALFFGVVAVRDAFMDHDLAVAAVTAVLLFCGLALWVYIAQDYRPGSSPGTRPDGPS